MNEVTVLSTAGELTGRAVGTGALLARRVAVATGRTATSVGLVGGRAVSRAAADAVRARRRMAEQSRSLSLPPVRVPDIQVLRHELATTIASPRRRRWPWVLVAVGVAGGAAALAVVRRPVAPPPAPTPPRVEDVRQQDVTRAGNYPALTDPAR